MRVRSLKRCLSAVFWAVKRHHPDSTEYAPPSAHVCCRLDKLTSCRLYLPYKAISSFLFVSVGVTDHPGPRYHRRA